LHWWHLAPLHTPMYLTYGLSNGKCNIMLSLDKLCKIPQWYTAFIMFMNAHANFTRFCLKATSHVCPFISGPPCHNKMWLTIMGEYFVLYSNIFRRVSPFHHNVYASMVSTWMVRNLMTHQWSSQSFHWLLLTHFLLIICLQCFPHQLNRAWDAIESFN